MRPLAAGTGIVWIVLLWAISAVFGSGSVAARERLAITPVTVVDVTDGSLHSDQTVLVEGDRITTVGSVNEVTVPEGAEVVNGEGSYLIPGLWDMHVHGTRRESTWPVYLANGVTGVREMFGRPDTRAFRAALAAKQIAAPRMFLVGPILDGSPPIWPGSVVVTTVEEARQAVIEQQQQGVDFIKVYQRLPRDVYYAILGESARQGLPVSGHVPSSVSPWEAAAAGQTTVEHLTQIALACSSEETRLRGEVVRSYIEAIRNQVEGSRSFSPAKCQLLYAAFIRNGVWMVPTLTVKRADGWRNDPQFTDDERLRYFDADTRSWLAPSAEDAPGGRWTEADYAMLRELYAFDQKVVGEMFRAGVRILAGTDTLNPYVFPGFSLHDELALLVDSGLTPLAALQAATSSAAAFMGKSDELGSVAPGKLADLVLLDANPLEDIRNTRRIRAVVADGRLYRREDLDRLLAGVEHSVQNSDAIMDSPGEGAAGSTAVADTLLTLAEGWMTAWNEMDAEGILAVLGEDLPVLLPGRADALARGVRVAAGEDILPHETWSIETFDPHVQVLGPAGGGRVVPLSRRDEPGRRSPPGRERDESRRRALAGGRSFTSTTLRDR